MQNYRFSLSFLMTAFLYILLGWMLLDFSTTFVADEQKPKVQKIALALFTFVPEVTPPVEEPTPENPEPEPVVEEVVEPVETAQPKVEPKPEPIPEPIIEKLLPKPIVKKQIPKKIKKKRAKKKRIEKPIVKKKVRHKKSKTKKHHQKSKHTTHKRSSKKYTAQASPAKKSAFLGAIRAKINKNKAYPRIAQRRGMQGVVKARFTIFANGKVGNITLSGKKVFYKSVRKAIQSAFPISVKNAPLSLPTTVNVTLRYQMR